MRKTIFGVTVFLLAGLFFGCGSTQTNRVDSFAQLDVGGRWGPNDFKQVSEELIAACLNNGRVTKFIEDYAVSHSGHLPACMVGKFGNDTSEHIDASILSKSIEIAIVNSGKMDFVAGGETRDVLREEREDQLSSANEETAVSFANEKGAALLLTGSFKSSVNRAGNTTDRWYFVSAELTDIETGVKLWMDESSEIRKVTTQSKFRF